MSIRIALSCFIFLSIGWSVFGQRTAVYTEANADFKRGLEFFDMGVYAMAQDEFAKVLDKLRPVNEPEYRLIKTKAELYYARSAVRLEQPDGQKLMLDFARKHKPDPTANEALLELADYYFNAKKYEEAIDFYAEMDQVGLTAQQRDEVVFKHAYCLYMRKRYDEAGAKFASVASGDGPFQQKASYYYGLSSYYGGNYPEAIEAWKHVEKTPAYRNQIPYFITQIYAAEQDYDQVIAYAEPRLSSGSRLKNEAEMHQLVGQAYFEKGDYKRALPHLVYAEEHSRRMRVEDFYQLGFVQYQTGQYEEAIPQFRQLDKTKTALGQSAMYYLADCYIKTGDLASARNAFVRVSKSDFDKIMQEDALFQYAKLSVELHFDRDAVNALRRFAPESRYYSEAQALLSETLVSTKDYKGAIRLIESIKDQSPQMKEAYQKVTYYQGIDDYSKGKYGQALSYFQKSLSVPVDTRIKAMSTFWIGEIHHAEKKYAQSKIDFDRFITMSSGIRDLPAVSSMASAHYSQGYNYIKTNDYNGALKHFTICIDKIESGRDRDEVLTSKILPDAFLRAGDCHFKRNKYELALDQYNKAIAHEATGYEYALFQKGIIQGLRGRPSDKLDVLKELIESHPNSSYADDALLEQAITYQDINQPGEAIRILEYFVESYKGRSDLVTAGYLRLGLITYNQGDVERALDFYKIIFQNNPTSKEAKDALAAIEEIYVEDLGRPDDYVAFVESLPGYEVSGSERDSLHYLVAQRYYENAEYDQAVSAFGDYLDKYPRGFYVLDALYNRGESYSLLRQFDRALLDYESTLQKGQSQYYLPALEKAALISYNHAQEFEKAHEYYAKLEKLTRDPQVKFDAQLGAMRAAHRVGDMKAVGTYADKVSANPLASSDDLVVASFFRGKILYEARNYNRALELFEGVIDNSDNEYTAEARYSVADIFYVTGDFDGAEVACRRSYSESSAYPFWVAKSLILLSDILVAKDDLFNARAALEAVIENFTDDEELVEIANDKLKKITQEEDRRNRIQSGDNSN